MWTVVYLAQNKGMADKLLEALEKEGLLVKIRPMNKSLGDNNSYEVLVPEAEIAEAHAIIIDIGF